MVTALAALVWSASACGGAPPPPAAESRGADGGSQGEQEAKVGPVNPAGADLQLWVSNQSFDDDPIHIKVSIDGVEVVAAPFAVEGQHNWQLFPLELRPGRHRLTAVSSSGVKFERTFTLSKGERRHAVLDYWYYSDTRRHFTFHVSKAPIAFG